MKISKFSLLKRQKINPIMSNYKSFFIYKNELDYHKKGRYMIKLSDIVKFTPYHCTILFMSKPIKIKGSGILRKTGKFSTRVRCSCGDSDYNKFSNKGR